MRAAKAVRNYGCIQYPRLRGHRAFPARRRIRTRAWILWHRRAREGAAAGENGNETEQSRGWKNEKADFFCWDGDPGELLGNYCRWKSGNCLFFLAGIPPGGLGLSLFPGFLLQDWSKSMEKLLLQGANKSLELRTTRESIKHPWGIPRCPCPWNETVPKVPSDPEHSVIPLNPSQVFPHEIPRLSSIPKPSFARGVSTGSFGSVFQWELSQRRWNRPKSSSLEVLEAPLLLLWQKGSGSSGSNEGKGSNFHFPLIFQWKKGLEIHGCFPLGMGCARGCLPDPSKENSPRETRFSMEIWEHSPVLELLPYLKSRILWNAESFQAFPELTKSKAFSFPSFVDFSFPKLGFMERLWPADGKIPFIPFSRSMEPPEPWRDGRANKSRINLPRNHSLRTGNVLHPCHRQMKMPARKTPGARIIPRFSRNGAVHLRD